jgi:hypothetical protein
MAIKLTHVQQRVMNYLAHGHTAYIEGVSAIYVQGEWCCGLETIKALERKGLVEKCGQWSWKAVDMNKVEKSDD